MRDDSQPIEIKKKKKDEGILEKIRSDKICKFLNTIPQCKATKRHQSGYGRKGDPDITGCLRGIHFEFEVKQPGKHLTQVQEVKIEEWKKAGAIAGRVENVNDVLDVFKQYNIPLYEQGEI
jgi:penicillin-binding protein-related factor A (putative recombinase)